MSNRSYRGRHAGRHRGPSRGVRASRALSAGFVLPTTAAAALVVTATGASVADSAPLPSEITLTGQQSQLVAAQERSRETVVEEIATRRFDAASASSALQGRNEADARAARAAKRKAIAAKKKAAAEAKAKAEAERKAKKWVRPIGVWRITSNFGARWGKNHDGIDLAAPTGTPLVAMSKGTVIKAGWEGSFGNKIEIQYWDGSISWYGHLSRIDVVAGQSVVAGTQVGAVGNTGRSFGSHLHLEFQQTTASDTPLNPIPWLTNHGLW